MCRNQRSGDAGHDDRGGGCSGHGQDRGTGRPRRPLGDLRPARRAGARECPRRRSAVRDRGPALRLDRPRPDRRLRRAARRVPAGHLAGGHDRAAHRRRRRALGRCGVVALAGLPGFAGPAVAHRARAGRRRRRALRRPVIRRDHGRVPASDARQPDFGGGRPSGRVGVRRGAGCWVRGRLSGRDRRKPVDGDPPGHGPGGGRRAARCRGRLAGRATRCRGGRRDRGGPVAAPPRLGRHCRALPRRAGAVRTSWCAGRTGGSQSRSSWPRPCERSSCSASPGPPCSRTCPPLREPRCTFGPRGRCGHTALRTG